jgi:hypothetical protein
MMQRSIFSVMALLFSTMLLACGTDDGGGGGKKVSEKDLLPAQCQIPYEGGAACDACIADCCEPCAAGSACQAWAGCTAACGEDFDCLTKCDEDHPGGRDDWMGADMCVVFECVEEDLCTSGASP